MNYAYPEYKTDLTEEKIQQCCELGTRLASEAGLVVRHEKFLEGIRNKPGVKIAGNRVHFAPEILRGNVEKYRARLKEQLEKELEKPSPGPWTMACGGFSMAVRDIETDQVRLATCQDLKNLIRLVNSFGIGGSYPVMPQDLPPLMRAIACFKICWEQSNNIRPYDYLDRRQTPFIYEMHRVMEKPFEVTLCVPQSLMIDEKDLDIFLDFYPEWKKNRNIRFTILDYPMLGITKPVTLTGSITMQIANKFSIYTLFNTFDPEIEIPVGISVGRMTDLRHACWAWGHPGQHMLNYLNSRFVPRMAGVNRNWYLNSGTLLETGSGSIDEQASLEKTGVALVAALQGGRTFSGLGSLCVDDLFSGVQFVIDVEIVNYVKETVESFDPHPDVISMDEDMYGMMRDVCLGKEEFLSHPDTVTKFRNIMPSSERLVREKLRSWMQHGKTLKDRAREECTERIKNFQPEFHLGDAQQKALDDIYARAEKTLLDKDNQNGRRYY